MILQDKSNDEMTAQSAWSSAAAKPAGQPAASHADLVREIEGRETRFAQAFSRIVAVLMRDRNFRNLKIADLEHLVLPAVMTGQWQVARGKQPSAAGTPDAPAPQIIAPVGVALWARVSPTIDARLSANLDVRMPLAASEWLSGDRFWLMAVAGDPRYLPNFLKHLHANEFKGADVKMRTRDADGKLTVTMLGKPAA